MSKVQLQGNVSGTGVFTIASPNSNTDRTLTLPDNTGTVITTGSTSGVSQAMLASGVAGNGPAFSAWKNDGAQSITASTATKVTFTTEIFDTNNNYASSRFTPTVAGYYQISGCISTSGTGGQSRIILMLFKNGTEYCTLQDLGIASFRYGGSQLIYLNGTTDYVEVFTFIAASGSIAVESGFGGTVGYNSMWSGAMVRAA
jgi:hypothetical protein